MSGAYCRAVSPSPRAWRWQRFAAAHHVVRFTPATQRPGVPRATAPADAELGLLRRLEPRP